MAYDPKRPKPAVPAEDTPAPVDALLDPPAEEPDEVPDAGPVAAGTVAAVGVDVDDADPVGATPGVTAQATAHRGADAESANEPPAPGPSAVSDELGGSDAPAGLSPGLVAAAVAAVAAVLAVLLLRRRRRATD